MTSKVIFQHIAEKDRIMASNELKIRRYSDGEIEIRITIGEEAERDVPMITHYLSADKAERLGRVLCGVDDDTFDGLLYRAKETIDES